jgi:hypothetical protein
MSSSEKRAAETDDRASNPDSFDDLESHLQGNREVAGLTADFRTAATTSAPQALDATLPLGSRLLPQSQEWPSDAQRDTDTHQAEGPPPLPKARGPRL